MIQQQRLIDTFLSLIRINSPSRREGSVMKRAQSELEQLGFTVEFDDAGQKIGGESGNLIARRPGRTSAAPVFYNAHLDTVQPTEGIKIVRKDGVISTDGTTILGADDKAGVACILEAIHSLDGDGVPLGPMEVVFTVGEEAGLLGAKAFDPSRLRARSGWVLDSGKPLDSIVNEAPSQDKIHAEIHGKAAHAGADPEAGISAITVAAHAIAAMPQGRIDHETTANVGVITGGQATNIVPPLCTLEAEARSRSDEKLDRQSKAMETAIRDAAAKFGARADVKIERAFSSFSVAPDAREIKIAREAMESLGLEPALRRTGGGSDANFFNQKGMRCVILGCGYEGIHSTEERIAEADMVMAARIIEAVMRIAGR